MIKFYTIGVVDMSVESRNKVISLLESFHEREQKIALLQYELMNFPQASSGEVIDGMGLGHGCELAPHSGFVSNKTLFIALNYQDRVEQINSETLNDILNELTEVDRVQSRLIYYVSILAPQQKLVIRQFYFEGRSWEEIAKEVKIALRTIHKIKNKALDKLAEFYDFSKIFQ